MSALFPTPEQLPPEFAEPLARAAGRLGPFGTRVWWYPDVPSTNDLAVALAERGAPEGCVVVANAQSAGRGRQGRAWVSPPGAGLYFSTVLHPLPHAVPLLTIAAGVAIAEGIESATGLTPRLKWPNDVYIAERKLAGVLAEAGSATSSSVQYVILGIGINAQRAAYPSAIAARATSLEGELGRVVDRGLLLAECLSSLAAGYEHLQRSRARVVMDAWRARASSTLGRAVRWDAAGVAYEGIAENIDDTGALLVRTDTGVRRVIAGEVQWS